ncbi:hypothetical protein AOE01nite_11070 [Acetobacter oeni]|uniref:Uncharacterized protein n=1 Tax=Acetobacter oeni TaxID=304077 RepID=A0A511XIV7_9PROT|nr:hypothetical protein AOE01nite_11070 [Acetobacter oeni]
MERGGKPAVDDAFTAVALAGRTRARVAAGRAFALTGTRWCRTETAGRTVALPVSSAAIACTTGENGRMEAASNVCRKPPLRTDFLRRARTKIVAGAMSDGTVMAP